MYRCKKFICLFLAFTFTFLSIPFSENVEASVIPSFGEFMESSGLDYIWNGLSFRKTKELTDTILSSLSQMYQEYRFISRGKGLIENYYEALKFAIKKYGADVFDDQVEQAKSLHADYVNAVTKAEPIDVEKHKALLDYSAGLIYNYLSVNKPEVFVSENVVTASDINSYCINDPLMHSVKIQGRVKSDDFVKGRFEQIFIPFARFTDGYCNSVWYFHHFEQWRDSGNQIVYSITDHPVLDSIDFETNSFSAEREMTTTFDFSKLVGGDRHVIPFYAPRDIVSVDLNLNLTVFNDMAYVYGNMRFNLKESLDYSNPERYDQSKVAYLDFINEVIPLAGSNHWSTWYNRGLDKVKSEKGSFVLPYLKEKPFKYTYVYVPESFVENGVDTNKILDELYAMDTKVIVAGSKLVSERYKQYPYTNTHEKNDSLSTTFPKIEDVEKTFVTTFPQDSTATDTHDTPAVDVHEVVNSVIAELESSGVITNAVSSEIAKSLPSDIATTKDVENAVTMAITAVIPSDVATTKDVEIIVNRAVNKAATVHKSVSKEDIESIVNEIYGFDTSSVELDLSPFKNIIIKDKFPFSIPWDFERLIHQFEPTSDSAPSFDYNILGATGTLNFDIFDDLASTLKSVINFAYVCLLIFLSIKFLGGK